MRAGVWAALVVAMWAGSAQAQSALCQNPGGFCGAKITSAGCLNRLSAGAGPETAAAEGDCAAQLGAYRDCVARAAEECGGGSAGAAGGACGPEDARQLWPVLAESTAIDELEGFARMCSGTPQALLAAGRARRLRGQAGAAPAAPRAAAAAAPVAPAVAQREPVQPAQPQPDYRAAQTELKRLGLYASSIDGDWGPNSTQALRAFQRDRGLSPADGALTLTVLEALRKAPTPDRTVAPAPVSEEICRETQTRGSRRGTGPAQVICRTPDGNWLPKN